MFAGRGTEEEPERIAEDREGRGGARNGSAGRGAPRPPGLLKSENRGGYLWMMIGRGSEEAVVD